MLISYLLLLVYWVHE